MKSNKLLIGILIVLTVGVLATSVVVVYLVLNPAQDSTSKTRGTDTDTTLSGPRIAYVSNQGSAITIQTINTDGSGQRLLSSPDLAVSVFPSWSPDGQHLAYIGSKETILGNDPVLAEMWVSKGDGSAHLQIGQGIANVVFVQPTWSPDGTRLAFVSWEETENEGELHSVIHIAPADGSGIERDIAFPLKIQELKWSPVKDELLIMSSAPDESTHVHVMSTDGSTLSNIHQKALSASWSPNGESVIVGDYSSLEIIIIQLDQNRQNPTAHAISTITMQPIEIAWSPSGNHVAVASGGHYRQGYSTNLHVINVESGESAAVVEGNGWVRWPKWSPDGQYLIFTWGELSMTLLRNDPKLLQGQILTFTGEDLPTANLWVYDVTSGQSQEQATGDGFEGMGVWSP